MIDIAALVPWLSAVSLVIAIGTAASAALSRGSKELSKRVDVIESEVADLARRLQTVESDVSHLPDRNMVHNLQLTLKDIQIEMASMRALTEQATRTSQRVEGWLVKRADEAAK